MEEIDFYMEEMYQGKIISQVGDMDVIPESNYFGLCKKILAIEELKTNPCFLT